MPMQDATEPVVPTVTGDHFAPPLQEQADAGPYLGSEPFGAMDFDLNSWCSTVEGSFTNAMLSDIGIIALMKYMDQLGEYHIDNEAENRMPTSAAPGASTSVEPQSPETPLSEQSYLCSWHPHDSSARCDHVAPDRPAFLRHLGEMHQVSGAQGATIICRLFNSKTGSACGRPIKRGNFPRHADTHYPLRYDCLYCYPGASFSRQDSWKKHMKSKHAETLDHDSL